MLKAIIKQIRNNVTTKHTKVINVINKDDIKFNIYSHESIDAKYK